VTLEKAIRRALAVSIDVTGYLRFKAAVHRATPIGMGFGKIRFGLNRQLQAALRRAGSADRDR